MTQASPQQQASKLAQVSRATRRSTFPRADYTNCSAYSRIFPACARLSWRGDSSAKAGEWQSVHKSSQGASELLTGRDTAICLVRKGTVGPTQIRCLAWHTMCGVYIPLDAIVHKSDQLLTFHRLTARLDSKVENSKPIPKDEKSMQKKDRALYLFFRLAKATPSSHQPAGVIMSCACSCCAEAPAQCVLNTGYRLQKHPKVLHVQ